MRYGAQPTPNGPRQRPLSLHLRSFARDPLAYLSECKRRYGDVVRLNEAKGFCMYALNHPDLIEEVLVKQHRNFTKSEGLKVTKTLLGEGLLTSEGDFWRRRRKLAQPAFHLRRVESYAGLMTAFTRRTLDAWRDGERRDMHREMMHLTLEIAAKTLFDVDLASEAETLGRSLAVSLYHFNRRVHSLIEIPEHWPTPANIRFRRAAADLHSIVQGIIKERRENPEDRGDLLSMLMAVQDDDGGQMTDRQLQDEVMTLLLAGHETTANLLSWSLFLLSQNPDSFMRLCGEIDAVLGERTPGIEDLSRLPYTDNVVQESLRLYPPAWIITRKSIEPCTIGDYRFEAGSMFLLSQWVVHRDARYFPEPDVFRPERWQDDLERRLPSQAYFPFGGGPRVCIGRAFALMEARLLLAMMVQRFEFELEITRNVQTEPLLTLRPKNGLPMRLRARRRS